MTGPWLPMPLDLRLEPKQIHLFLLSAAPEAAVLAYFETLLTDEDRQRIDRFRIPEKRTEALISRGSLRHILGHFLKVPPQELAFSINPNGKPYLAGHPLHFNLSHTLGRVIVAVSRDGEVGVDIENVGRGVSHEELAERFFTPSEHRALKALPVDERAVAFLRCWTRKEAVLKAKGRGIGDGLDSFEVPVNATQTPVRVGAWHVHNLPLEEDYVGSLAAACAGADLRYWSYGEGIA